MKSSATWTARGMAKAIVDALQKANADNDIVGLQVGGKRVPLNQAAAKHTIGGYVQGNLFDFSEYEVTLEERDGGQEVIQGADVAAKGIKVLKTESKEKIEDGMPLTEANVGGKVDRGLKVTFLHEASGAKAYVMLNVAQNEKLVLASFDYRLQGESEWKPLFRPMADQTDNFRFAIPVPKADLDSLIGKKVELRASYTDEKNNA